ncbi:hypothetical protein [Cupriavidus basilensis]|uniref:hypothetical protein n=1 Tax=Cupriavidus basilensis TaxID=68895 RepID=UPI0002E17DC6|nr:hypothetical protein [Cupriavidus basilensis]
MSDAQAAQFPYSIGSGAHHRQEIFLNLNESPFGLSERARQAAAASLAGAGRYQFELVERLRKAIALAQGVPIEWVSLYPGSNRALHYATQAFMGAKGQSVFMSVKLLTIQLMTLVLP